MKRLPLFTLALAVILLVFDFLLVVFYTASKFEFLYFAITPGIAHFLAAFTVTGSVLVSCSLIYWFRKDRLEQAAKEKLIAELSESERRFRELFDLSQAFICIHTPEGIITSVNQRA
ncbi:MAG TPA: hypothetical protein VNK26_05425, partial [Pyrinomonadaceae bacterium]|nr:hypothetical protein [Pyrinomonadaceae bacterium]